VIISMSIVISISPYGTFMYAVIYCTTRNDTQDKNQHLCEKC